MTYLVSGNAGPGFATAREALQVLENVILPGFDAIIAMEAAGKIVAGGVPVGDRSFVFIAEAPGNDALDELLRDLPMWGVLQWTVTPLQSFAKRAAMERKAVDAIKVAGA
jgi:hypothetical protein